MCRANVSFHNACGGARLQVNQVLKEGVVLAEQAGDQRLLDLIALEQGLTVLLQDRVLRS